MFCSKIKSTLSLSLHNKFPGSFFQIIFFLVFYIKHSHAFGKTGHFIVARIAEIQIENEPFYSEVLKYLEYLPDRPGEETFPFIECSSWADEIKKTGDTSMDEWHFNNQYIDGSHILSKNEVRHMGLIKSDRNIVWAVNQMKTSLEHRQVTKKKDKISKSVHLRMLIHLLGDLHQPLHNVTLINDDFPNSDKGGNAFEIKSKQVSNLHLLWDRNLLEYRKVSKPLSQDDFDYIDQISSEIIKEFSLSDGRIANLALVLNPATISTDSAKIAIQYCYNIKKGSKPSKEYLKSGFQILKMQLALAGYRLANILREIFQNNSQAPILQQNQSVKKQTNFVWVRKDTQKESSETIDPHGRILKDDGGKDITIISIQDRVQKLVYSPSKKLFESPKNSVSILRITFVFVLSFFGSFNKL